MKKKDQKNGKTRFAALLLAAVTALSALPMAGCSGRGKPPALDDVYDRLVEVIEASHRVNGILFGVGLPTYPREGAEEELLHRYYGMYDTGLEYVTPYAMFISTAEMREAVKEVYSASYRESLFEMVFTGYATSGISAVMPARYTENDKRLFQHTNVDPLVRGVRVYDYAEMKMERGSDATYIRISIPSYTDESPEEWVTSILSFVYEEGNWYLNSPSC